MAIPRTLAACMIGVASVCAGEPSDGGDERLGIPIAPRTPLFSVPDEAPWVGAAEGDPDWTITLGAMLQYR